MYKARSGYQVSISPQSVRLVKGMSVVSFNRDSISEVSIKSSMYDLPFLERTIVIRLNNKKKYTIKRLRKGVAKDIYRILTR